MDSITSEFIELYKRLENLIDNTYSDCDGSHGSLAWLVHEKKLPRSLCDEADLCREVRNLLHHNVMIRDECGISVNEVLIESLREIYDFVQYTPRALDVCIRKQDVYWVSRSQNALSVMEHMQEHAYTYAPLLDDGVVDGVFDMNVLLSYMLREGIVGEFDKLTLSDFGDDLSLDSCSSEVFEFVSRHVFASDVAKLFSDNLCDRKQLGIVFVTENGKPAEKLLGIITAWDMSKFF